MGGGVRGSRKLVFVGEFVRTLRLYLVSSTDGETDGCRVCSIDFFPPDAKDRFLFFSFFFFFCGVLILGRQTFSTLTFWIL